MCSLETVLESTGESQASRIKAVEIIFTETNGFDFSFKDKLPNLRSLTLIQTNLVSMSNLGSIGCNLKCLQLTNQGITSMENLVLPNLTQLVLQDNLITKIEGLSGCPRLRRLWLSRNRIKRIENLHYVGDLRELWLQGNQLQNLQGLESNASLRSLAVAGNNDITSLEQIEPLAMLPNLRELSFQDITFGECPIVDVEGYYNSAICTLSQIRVLDNVRVNDADRAAAEDDFVNEQLAFNDRLEELHEQHEAELRDINEKRKVTAREAENLRAQLIQSFVKLEEVVTKGRERIRKEQEKQKQIRDKNTDQLRQRIASIREEHRNAVDSLIEKESKIMKEYDKKLDAIEKRANFELEESVMLAELQCQSNSENQVVFQVLKNESTTSQSISTELLQLCSILSDAQNYLKRQRLFKIFRACKMFNRSLYNLHKLTVVERNLGDELETVQAFTLVKTLHTAREVIMKGLSATLSKKSSSSGGVVLFSDPIVAAGVCNHPVEDEHESIQYYRTFIFRLVLGRYMTLKGKSPSSSEEALSWLERIPQDCTMVKIEYSAEPESDQPSGFFIVVRPEAIFLAYPEIYMILEWGESPFAGSGPKNNSKHDRELVENIVTKDLSFDTVLQDILSEVSQTQNFSSESLSSLADEDRKILESIENKMEQHLKHYEDCILHEMDPKTADSISKTESKALDYRAQLGEIRAQIDQEKAKQEQILREFRSGASSTNPPRRKKYSL